MLGFTILLSILDFDELKKVLSIVAIEKELRFHGTAELEDFLEMLGDDKGRVMYPGIRGVGTLRIHHTEELPDAEDLSSDSGDRMDET